MVIQKLGLENLNLGLPTCQEVEANTSKTGGSTSKQKENWRQKDVKQWTMDILTILSFYAAHEGIEIQTSQQLWQSTRAQQKWIKKLFKTDPFQTSTGDDRVCCLGALASPLGYSAHYQGLIVESLGSTMAANWFITRWGWGIPVNFCESAWIPNDGWDGWICL